MVSHRILIAFAATCVLPLLGCSTSLLNLNTLDLASTFSDVTIRQIVFNLAKTEENAWFVPSQVQLNNGIIAARTNVTPSYTNPIGSTIFNTAAIARSTTTTTTSTFENMSASPSASLSGTLEDTSTWNVTPIQDPEPLKRLQLLYQYGAGKKTAIDLLCLYPVPEMSDAKQPAKSDLQALADALSANAKAAATKEKNKEDKKAGGDAGSRDDKDPPDKKTTDDKQSKADQLKKYYIRGEFPESCQNVSGSRPFDAPFTLIGNNPDIAFLLPPVCVLCQFPNKPFDARIKAALARGARIYMDRTSDAQVPYDPSAQAHTQYIPVVLNEDLSPIGPDRCGEPALDGRYHWHDRLAKIDWLFVDPVGAEIPAGRTVIGTSNGYVISTTCPRSFAQFVLAIREATLQSPLVEKAGAGAPRSYRPRLAVDGGIEVRVSALKNRRHNRDRSRRRAPRLGRHRLDRRRHNRGRRNRRGPHLRRHRRSPGHSRPRGSHRRHR